MIDNLKLAPIISALEEASSLVIETFHAIDCRPKN